MDNAFCNINCHIDLAPSTFTHGIVYMVPDTRFATRNYGMLTSAPRLFMFIAKKESRKKNQKKSEPVLSPPLAFIYQNWRLLVSNSLYLVLQNYREKRVILYWTEDYLMLSMYFYVT